MEERKDIGKKMRILEVVDNYYPTIDGVVNVVDNYAKLLNKRAECTVLAPKYPNSPMPDGYTLIQSKSISWGRYIVRLPLPIFDFKLIKYFKENKFDVVHVHSPVTLARFVLKYAKKNNIPTVFTVHTKYHEEINAHIKFKCLRKMAMSYIISNMRKVNYIWAVSDGAKKMLHETYGVEKDCVVVRNGAELSPEFVDLQKVEEIRRKYSLQGNTVLLAVGRLVKVKNFDLIISAMKPLKDKGLKVKLLIVGGGEYEKELKKLVKSLDLSDTVIFTERIADKRSIADYYAVSDLLVTASTFDTSSLVVRDAYALSLPVLAVKDSFAAEGIIDGENGFLAENSTVSFADKLSNIIERKETLPTVGKRGHDELYAPWEKIVEEVFDRYSEIAERT